MGFLVFSIVLYLESGCGIFCLPILSRINTVCSCLTFSDYVDLAAQKWMVLEDSSTVYTLIIISKLSEKFMQVLDTQPIFSSSSLLRSLVVHCFYCFSIQQT